MPGFLDNLFRRRTLGRLESIVADVNALEGEVSNLSSDELKNESQTLKDRVKNGESLEAVLPRAFALVREAAKRALHQRPYDVQLMGGVVIHEGGVAEMGTGEGKTLAAVAPVYTNALKGEGVHVVTVNEYLARRDAVWMGQVYRLLGLSVACLVPNAAFLYDPEWKIPEDAEALIDRERDATGSFRVQQEFLRPITRREAYLADITYGTNHEFGFDYLRDNLAYALTQQVQRGHSFAVIDEVDSILIDEARTPLIISAPDTESSELYKTFTRLVKNLQPEEDYEVDEKRKSVLITASGIAKMEKMIGVPNLYAPEQLRLVHYLEECLKAHALFKLDRDYVVRNGEIIIVDEFTGRLLQGRRYNGGLHQAIEAKEGVKVQEESRTYGKISIQNYFRMYKKIAGMTGTAQTSAEEFHKVYGLEVVAIPPNKPTERVDAPDLIYKTTEGKWQAIVQEVKRRHEAGQPVLVGTTSISKNEMLSELLHTHHVPHEVLNAKKNEEEGGLIAQAGKTGKVTVATNIAGRGVDIILGGNPQDPEEARKVRELGGLCVIGTERHEARRIDNQLRGRSGRQGDPGFSQFYLSLEDDLMRIFGGDRIKAVMDRFDLPEDQPIQNRMVSNAVAQAQAKVEGANFDQRKHLLEYDDVLNKQRGAFYRRRSSILESMNPENLASVIYDAATAHAKLLESLEIEEREKAFKEAALGELPENLEKEEDMLRKRSLEAALDHMTPSRLLQMLDLLWLNHLEDLDALMESIGLRAYAQRDPLVEYREESHRLFEALWRNFNEWVFANVFKLANSQGQADNSSERVSVQPILVPSGSLGVSSDIGRNDPCPCGSGKKYKKCGLLNTEEHQKNLQSK